MLRRKKPAGSLCKQPAQIELMRRAGQIVALTLRKLGDALKPGMTTGALDDIAEQTIRGFGAVPAFLNYRGYPATACISLNEEVVHGIPGPRTVKTGDLVSVDLGAIMEGWYADAAYTFPVGPVSAQAERLMAVGKEALQAGIEAARPGNRVRDIGAAIEKYVHGHGFTVVHDLCGHGIGRRLHEDPQVPNYPDRRANLVLEPGMTLAIEPMVNAGTKDVGLLDDNWTYITVDRSLSVHYEHTVVIREGDAELLTLLSH